MALDDSSGIYLVNGKLLENMGDLTFAKSFITTLDSILMLQNNSGSSSGPLLKWVRFKEMHLTDYYYLNKTRWDAV